MIGVFRLAPLRQSELWHLKRLHMWGWWAWMQGLLHLESSCCSQMETQRYIQWIDDRWSTCWSKYVNMSSHSACHSNIFKILTQLWITRLYLCSHVFSHTSGPKSHLWVYITPAKLIALRAFSFTTIFSAGFSRNYGVLCKGMVWGILPLEHKGRVQLDQTVFATQAMNKIPTIFQNSPHNCALFHVAFCCPVVIIPIIPKLTLNLHADPHVAKSPWNTSSLDKRLGRLFSPDLSVVIFLLAKSRSFVVQLRHRELVLQSRSVSSSDAPRYI